MERARLPATARSVRDAAERLGYRPNQAARNLRLGTTRTVLLMVPTLSAPFFGPVYTGAARVAAQHGFGVVVSTWPDDAAGPADSPFGSDEAIDGILASSMPVDALGRFRETPAVMLDSGPDGGVPTVDFGVADGMRAIADHLVSLGHRRFGHVAAAVDQWTFHARAEALAAAVAALPGGVLTRGTCAIEVTSAKDAAYGCCPARSRRPRWSATTT